MKKRIISLAVVCVFHFGDLNAKEQLFQSEDTAFLQSSCREVIEIYSRKQEVGKYAALHTSMSEAMRAGYCIGVLQQYIKHSPSCKDRRYRRSSWFDLAQAIVKVSLTAEQSDRVRASDLMEEAYCNG
ncbi:hypothetical protein PULV_a1652 [Pseudoalteromonas ulvae UL12]|uniref:Rap1a immunity protein domain-containing protein n=1 Tax=Pseudoalteromonas ulvae TaxID=107327 RepID=A0A244CMY2_PSEDV|nr:hypothetical protein [Pseudoalteromonas ulvae]MBE0364097.1 hypothetical protein [Pseudoalteromonas ulvae UL12]OUL56866.1 hypothetical protein B1199_15990 [Pseudoalteromonas ulvae]